MKQNFEKLYEEVIKNDFIQTEDGFSYIPYENELKLRDKGFILDDESTKELIKYYNIEKDKNEEKAKKQSGIKKCNFCAEEIKQEAIKCKHCREFIDGDVRKSNVVKINKKIDSWKIILIIFVIWIIQGVVVNITGKEQIIKDGDIFAVISIVWLPAIFIASYLFEKYNKRSIGECIVISFVFVIASWLAVSIFSLGTALATIEYAIIIFFILNDVGKVKKKRKEKTPTDKMKDEEKA